MEQIRRITAMEDILTRAQAAASAADAPGCLAALQSEIDALEAYYTGPLWMKDYLDDCAGRLPKELKRGVLSEDAVYDLLSSIAQLRREQSDHRTAYIPSKNRD